MKSCFTILLPLIALLLFSCQKKTKLHTIQFTVTKNLQSFTCDTRFNHNNQNWQLSQLQFFIHDIKFKTASGSWVNAKLHPTISHSKAVALIGGLCDGKQIWQLSVNAPLNRNEIFGLQFSLGVPESLNHLNPLRQPSPLNQPDMFWSWQMGHKFLRLEMNTNQQANQSKMNTSEHWLLHVGATGCSSSSPVRSPQTSCKNPNVSTIQLPDYSASKKVFINMMSLIQGLNLNSKTSCQSSPNTPSCRTLLPRLGIQGNQVLFTVIK